MTPVAMFLAWIAISGWVGSARDLLVAVAAAFAICVVAGWIVGYRSGRSIRSGLLDVVAYPTVAWLIILPVGAIASVASGVADNGATNPGGTLLSIVFFAGYGLVSSLYVIPLLTPFGAGWTLTYLALRRGMRV